MKGLREISILRCIGERRNHGGTAGKKEAGLVDNGHSGMWLINKEKRATAVRPVAHGSSP